MGILGALKVGSSVFRQDIGRHDAHDQEASLNTIVAKVGVLIILVGVLQV